MAKVTLEGMVVSVHREKRMVEGTRTPEELEALKEQDTTEERAGPKLEAVEENVARVAVSFPGGARPDVFPQFAAAIEVWGAEPTSLGKTVQIAVEVIG